MRKACDDGERYLQALEKTLLRAYPFALHLSQEQFNPAIGSAFAEKRE
jgi:hypothetical protein